MCAHRSWWTYYCSTDFVVYSVNFVSKFCLYSVRKVDENIFTFRTCLCFHVLNQRWKYISSHIWKILFFCFLYVTVNFCNIAHKMEVGILYYTTTISEAQLCSLYFVHYFICWKIFLKYSLGFSWFVKIWFQGPHKLEVTFKKSNSNIGC